MAGLAYRISFGIALVVLLTSVVLGALAAGRDGGYLPGLPSPDPLQLASVSYETSTTDEWVEQMRSYTEIQPRNALAWQALGLARKRRGEPGPAVVACRRAIALGDWSGRCDRALARIYLDAGREDQARLHARAAYQRGLPLARKLRDLLADGEDS